MKTDTALTKPSFLRAGSPIITQLLWVAITWLALLPSAGAAIRYSNPGIITDRHAMPIDRVIYWVNYHLAHRTDPGHWVHSIRHWHLFPIVDLRPGIITSNYTSLVTFVHVYAGSTNLRTLPATMDLHIVSSVTNGNLETYNLRMLRFDIRDGIGNLWMRLDPAQPSLGVTTVSNRQDGTFYIESFFDLAFDGWQGDGANGTARVQLADPSPPEFNPEPNTLPPTNAFYVQAADAQVAYKNGLRLRRIRHRHIWGPDFTPPVEVNVAKSFTFSSKVDFEYSTDGGVTFTAAADVDASMGVSVTLYSTYGTTRYFNTEMTLLDIAVGDTRIRLNPDRVLYPSLGRTSLKAAGGGSAVASYFQLFTQVSLNGGGNWSDALDPVEVSLMMPRPGMIPTLSEWGLILLTLLLLTAGTVVLLRRQPLLAGAQGTGAAMGPTLPMRWFVPALFVRVFTAVLAPAVLAIGIVIWQTGSMAPTDIGGTLACAALVAYWVHLLLAARKGRVTDRESS